MSAEFFSKYVGTANENCVDVREAIENEHGKRLVCIDSQRDPIWLTPEQAKALGRALIKAGKFVEKEAKK